MQEETCEKKKDLLKFVSVFSLKSFVSDFLKCFHVKIFLVIPLQYFER